VREEVADVDGEASSTSTVRRHSIVGLGKPLASHDSSTRVFTLACVCARGSCVNFGGSKMVRCAGAERREPAWLYATHT
jgi:hypothetical protein